MTKRRLIRWSLMLVILAAFAVWLEPTRVVWGWLRGEAFYQGRPTSWWREVLRKDGEQGMVQEETVRKFRARPGSVFVLREALIDTDHNVRRPAAFVLRLVGPLYVHESLPALRQALRDSDIEVKLQAAQAIAMMRANGRQAGADLVELMKDPDAQVQLFAERALWEVHPSLAKTTGSWTAHTSDRWQFSVVFPGNHTEEEKPSIFVGKELITHVFTSRHGASIFTVAITEHPPAFFGGTERERQDMSRDLMLFGTGAKLLDDAEVEQKGIRGRQLLAIHESTKTYMKSRSFWVDKRLYHVMATYSPEFAVIPAADYFLDSFAVSADACLADTRHEMLHVGAPPFSAPSIRNADSSLSSV